MKLFYLVLGGAAGTISRYILSGVIHENMGSGFPYGTLVVNGLGCLTIGLLSTVQDGRFLMDDNMRMLLAVGFCGAFTTFSTFISESAHFAKSGGILGAFWLIGLSIAVGAGFFILGHRLGKLF